MPPGGIQQGVEGSNYQHKAQKPQKEGTALSAMENQIIDSAADQGCHGISRVLHHNTKANDRSKVTKIHCRVAAGKRVFIHRVLPPLQRFSLLYRFYPQNAILPALQP